MRDKLAQPDAVIARIGLGSTALLLAGSCWMLD